MKQVAQKNMQALMHTQPAQAFSTYGDKECFIWLPNALARPTKDATCKHREANCHVNQHAVTNNVCLTMKQRGLHV